MAKKYDTEKFSVANDMAEYYWAVQIEADPNLHLSLQQDFKKLNATLFTWTKEFYKLIEKHNPLYSEVERVIRFVQYGKYFQPAKYSAGYLCSKYLAIRELMESIEARPFMPEF